MEQIPNNGTSGSEVNEAEGFEHLENVLSGFREQHENDTDKDVIVIDDDVDENVRDEEKNFVLGDVVWVLRMTNIWWPGIISEPSSSSKGLKNFIHNKDSFFIKLFSSTFSVWASKSRLKEFTRCFDEMVKQNDSRSFISAVEKAVNEISSHVKKELTCSCFQKPCPPRVLELKSFALSRFEPDQLLSFIKHLAIDGVVSQRVQITVTRDCVSTFYRSLGHPQLQVHQLSPNRNTSRKRSRNENEKRVYGSNVGDIVKIMKSSSEEMFDHLGLAAVDGSFNKEKRSSGSLKRFFSCFRKFAFLNNEESEKTQENGLQLVTLPRPPGFSPPPENGLQLVTLPPPPPPGPGIGPLPPNLVTFMKEKLDMMKSTLEKEGHTLSSEMRGKLEDEIHSFEAKYISIIRS